MVKVTVLAYTQPADRNIQDIGTEHDTTWATIEELLAAEKRICNEDVLVSFWEIIEKEIKNPELVKKRIIEAITSKPEPHQGLFEHISFTFLIEDISRVATHQLVRHRMASYLQMSQRSTKMDNVKIIVPPSVPDDMKELFQATQEDSLELYNYLMEKGVPMDDARYVMPHGDETRLVMTLNGSSLMHFLKLRTDKHAQWEIKEVAYQMWSILLKICPTIFNSENVELWK